MTCSRRSTRRCRARCTPRSRSGQSWLVSGWCVCPGRTQSRESCPRTRTGCGNASDANPPERCPARRQRATMTWSTTTTTRRRPRHDDQGTSLWNEKTISCWNYASATRESESQGTQRSRSVWSQVNADDSYAQQLGTEKVKSPCPSKLITCHNERNELVLSCTCVVSLQVA